MLKKILSILAISLGTIFLVELGAYGFFYIKYGQPLPREEIQASLVPFKESEEFQLQTKAGLFETNIREHILHPYLGFIRDFRKNRHIFDDRIIQIPVNPFGFFGPSPLAKKRNGEIRIAITGGSVALQLFLYSRESLIKVLEEIDIFRKQKVEIISLALGGMKQPQQLLAINWFLALGADIDVVINIDGFNEVALPQIENMPEGVYPFYPRQWNVYAAKSMSEKIIELLSKGVELKKEREELRNLFSKNPFKSSNFFLVIWHSLKNKILNELITIDNKIHVETKANAKSTQEIGPDYLLNSSEQVALDFAEFWKNSSRQMNDVLKAKGIEYFHYLQPNQYFKGSKPLSKWERKSVYFPDAAHADPVQTGYPILIKAGLELNEMGVQFVDLTGIFKNETDTLYKDSCCHYNQIGNDILAKEIGASIKKYYSSRN